MDLLGYAALGGLERLTIVAGAVIIGYWGYRLYTAEKSAGLVFMGLAVLVLVGALATGGSYVRSLGEGYQLASLPAESGEAPPPAASESPFVDSSHPSAPESGAVSGEPDVAASAPAPAEVPVPETSAVTAPEPAVEIEMETPAPEAPAAEPVPAQPQVSPVRIATGQELGGRIVSVKSENVSLEWSSDSE